MKRLLVVLLVLALCLCFPLTAADRRINDDAGSAIQKNPALAENRYGFMVLVWEDYRDGSPEIYGQIVSNKGQLIRSNLQFSPATPTTSKRLRPDVAVGEQGEFAVVWEDSTAAGTNVFVRWFTANGVARMSPVRVNSVTSAGILNPAVAIDARGNTIVCWQDSREAGSMDVYVQRFNSQYSPLGNNVRVNSETRGTQKFPAISIGPEDQFIIVWEDGRDYTPPTGFYAIYGQRYNAQGTPVAGNVQISHHPSSAIMAMRPSVAMQYSGDYMVCWQYGTPPTVMARFTSLTNPSLNREFNVPDYSSGSSISAALLASVSARIGYGYVVAFIMYMGSDGHIFTRSFDNSGVAEATQVQRSETGSNKYGSCLGINVEGIHTMIWEDGRNGNGDIYGNWFGPRIPLNVTVGSGFNGRIPITWDPPYGREDITRYIVHRSTSGSGPFVSVATVDLTLRGSYGAQMRDWLDTMVNNGTTYYYTVTADASGTDGASHMVSATPAASGHVLNSLWATSTPTIDGVINPMEWYEARKINIANPYTKATTNLYVKNSNQYLFLAVDDTMDAVVDNGNQMGIVYDYNNNQAWPATLPSNEGAILITALGAWFAGYAGEYPNHLAFANAAALTTLPAKVTASGGHVQYEVAIPVAGAAGRTLGFSTWINDPGHFYPLHYGYAAEWPFGYLWESPQALGKLVLATPSAVVTGFAVTNTNDSGAGSLRQALKDADDHAGPDSVFFKIPLTDPGYDPMTGTWTIRPSSSPLNLTKNGTVLWGSSQAQFIGNDSNPNGPEIVIDGTNMPTTWALGLYGSENVVQGLVLNNFNNRSLEIQGVGNKVIGCYIGTDATGMQRKGRAAYGILLRGAKYTVIGGTTSFERNIISGNSGVAIHLEEQSHYNTILGNFIGVNRTGNDSLRNQRGVSIHYKCRSNIIGPGNVISGNRAVGIELHGRGCDSTRIVGNYIGTSADGTKALGNTTGINVSDSTCYAFIGGSVAKERNIISGNGRGLNIISMCNSYHVVQGNYIGVDASCGVALPNTDYGILVAANENLFGGLEPGEGNVISGNGKDGFYFASQAARNRVEGNFIGTDTSGTVPLANVKLGVFMGYGAHHNVIGPENRIAYNGEDGVRILDPASNGNTITRNRIYGNSASGIELQGGNQDLVAPVITSLAPVSGTATANGVVEIFSTQDNEGDLFEAAVIADASGHFEWNGVPHGPVVTATVTDESGNTSEFSRGHSTRVTSANVQSPFEYALLQNYPNPFNPSTTIRFGVKETGRVHIELFDIMGRSVAVLLDRVCEAGHHEIRYRNTSLASGVYFYRIQVNEFAAVKKMILMQ